MNETRENNRCWICGSQALANNDFQKDIWQINCPKCGEYVIDGSTFASTPSETEKWRLSCAVRMRHELGQDTTFHFGNKNDLIAETRYPQTPLDLIDNLMIFFERHSHGWGHPVKYDAIVDFPAIGVRDQLAFETACRFTRERGLIEDPANGQVNITLDGWDYLDSMKNKNRESNKVFVAMWFSEDMRAAWESGIREAIVECGYEPIRVDLKEYNTKICDMIIADIRSSKFLIADLTGDPNNGDRGGVYYEAGFGHGLGKQVILTCQKVWFDEHKVHFDLNHHNVIVYEDVNVLKTRLVNRIGATIV